MVGKETYFMNTQPGKHENDRHSKIIKLQSPSYWNVNIFYLEA